jgi:hypothetical protein
MRPRTVLPLINPAIFCYDYSLALGSRLRYVVQMSGRKLELCFTNFGTSRNYEMQTPILSIYTCTSASPTIELHSARIFCNQ